VALIVLVTVLVLGIAWFTVGALGKAAPTAAETETRTAAALKAGKQALLAYVAQYAARSGNDEPGQMPCPESLTLSNPAGQSSSSCSASAVVVGRLPWRTLGIDQLRDGDGEPLWYVMRGFRNPPINFGSAGQLSYNGSAVVALIIAPGRPLNTASLAGTPPADCTKQNQMVATRNTATLVAANFIECGLATGSVTTPGDPTWTNDRVIAITAAEWADAVAPAVADRLQRQLAPALEDWRATQSVAIWGSSFLPFASTFGDPSVNDLCGDGGVREGLPPFASKSPTGCPRFTASSSLVLGLLAFGCLQSTTTADCSFRQLFGTPPFSAHITATALAGAGFRDRITAADILSGGGAISNFSLSYNASTGIATVNFDVTWPVTLAVGSVVTVSVPHLPDAAWLADSRVTWFTTNDWARYTYYAVSQDATPGGSGTCSASTCLTINGLTASNGSTNDKKLLLVLSGRPLAGTTWPSSAVGSYFEGANASTGDRTYETRTAGAAFNDRVAACPFQQTDAGGTAVPICN
jgi:hypothetical protein